MSDSSRHPTDPSDKKWALLASLLQEDVDSSPNPRISPRPEGTTALSFAQERLLFLDQLEPNSSAYTISGGVRLEGDLNVGALERALNEIVTRHEVLRTTFPIVDGEPVRQVATAPPSPLPIVDLTHLSQTEQALDVQRRARADADRSFNLEEGPLFRTTLLRLAPQTHVLLLSMHHIVCDGWSFGILDRELTLLYNASVSGTPASLPELSIQYVDFAYWQRQWLQGTVLQEQTAYWKQQLTGAPAVLELPTDRPRPPVQSFNGAAVKFLLPTELADRVSALSRKEGVTPFMVLLAAFKTVLYRYGHQDDVVVGSPIASRNRVEIENLIGFFVNTIVLRTNLSGNPTFRELLQRVREVALGAYAHQDLPFEKLVEELRPERSLSHSTLFQVMFVLQNAPAPPLKLAGLTSSDFAVERTTAKFDLSLYLYESREGLQGLLEYNTDLFDVSTMERMQRHFRSVLEGALADPSRQLDELPLLDAAERHELLTNWNQTNSAFQGNDRCLHHVFEEQARKSPERVAVVFERQQLTYEQLDRRANQLAHYLRKLGVGPDVLVGLFLDRSLDMVVGLLGTLKAGGAYVPIDPEYPSDRVAFMLQDCAAPIVLTQKTLASKLPPCNATVLCLDEEWERIAREDIDNPAHVSEPGHLAYTIYTSGSTGKPKGVQIEHRNLSNLLYSMQSEPRLSKEDTLLAVTTLSFDIAGLEIYLPLISGARLVIASYWVARDGVLLLDLLRQSGATVMQATPSTWGLLIEAGWDGSPELKVLCGGEAMPPELARKLTQRSRSVWNVYGPTETTIWSSVYRLTGHEKGAIPIGHPIANTQIHVLDAHLNPLPINVSGEIYIGGEGLARGYLNRPELTAEKFVPDPFAAAPGERLYRTGDLGRRLADGGIECLGRLDHQVKLRGFRIELGEIEAVLARHPSIKQSVVIAREDTPGDKRLVAYAETDQGRSPSSVDLRAQMKQELPDYMIPSTFVFVDKLPLTPNGKIDRKKLPPPGEETLGTQTRFVAPRDALEHTLAQLWSRILKVKRVGIFDNFFDLGGHSLAAVRMVAEVRRLSGKNLPLATLFQASTVAAVAEILRNDGWSPSWSSLVSIQPLGSKPPLFLVHGAEGNVLLYQRLTHHLGLDQPVYGLQSQGLSGNGRLDTTIEEMASRYVKEITVLQPHGPYFVGGYCLGGIIAYEMAQQLTALGEKVELVIMLETYNIASIVSRPGDSLRRAVRGLQNIGFHALNGLSLAPKDRWEFLREKAEISWTRLGVKAHAFYHAVQRLSGRQIDNAYPHLAIKRLNDRAADQYVPRPYEGRVALIRSNEYFLDRTNPQFGWERCVQGGPTVCELSMYPRAMLMEPFCQSLAETLKSLLEDN